jgi:hypothetical protein
MTGKQTKSTPTPPATIHIYTYGYCSNYNKRGARAGMGIYVRDTSVDDAQNRSKLTILEEKQTSEVASLLAVEKVVESAKKRTHIMYPYFNNPSHRVVLHVDTQLTAEMCTGKGEQLEKEGFPPRASIDTIKRVYTLVKPLRASGVLRVVHSQPERFKTDYEGTQLAKRHAKNAVQRAHDGDEGARRKYYDMNSDFGPCMYDDGPIIYLDVPPHEYTYARSKGAWWDNTKKTFFLYENDVGCHYDMTRVDYLNLRIMFE